MTDQKPAGDAPSTAATAAEASKAKQAAAKAKKAAQRSQAKSKTARVMVYMRGASHGAVDGQKRYFDQATAERLVRLGHARLPESRG